jgi:SAM-dependent MidA family methyltransferase
VTESVEQAIHKAIGEQIVKEGGLVDFERFMSLALYAPGLGYYVNGAQKFGVGGDFITAPELSPLFGYSLANQIAEIFAAIQDPNVLEFGAGSGALAVSVLEQLEQLDCLPVRYQILELSAELQQRQRDTIQQALPHLIERVEWLSHMPPSGWRGVVLANEVLDAMPVQRIRKSANQWQMQWVSYTDDAYQTTWKDTTDDLLLKQLDALEARLGQFEEGYESEVNRHVDGWISALSLMIEQGAVILVDYGYPEAAFYHPERSAGTLICHHQHKAYNDPLQRVGSQDITANVDFSAVAEAGVNHGFDLAGFTTQSFFLMNSGIGELLNEDPMSDHYIHQAQAMKQLTLPTEMGERFKVIAFSKGLDLAMRGFSVGDQRAYL